MKIGLGLGLALDRTDQDRYGELARYSRPCEPGASFISVT
jgi:hypothetical protein